MLRLDWGGAWCGCHAIRMGQEDLVILATAYLVFYAVCIAIFAIPTIRSSILRSKYSHMVITFLVIASYSAVIIVNVLGPSRAPYGGLPLLRR